MFTTRDPLIFFPSTLNMLNYFMQVKDLVIKRSMLHWSSYDLANKWKCLLISYNKNKYFIVAS